MRWQVDLSKDKKSIRINGHDGVAGAEPISYASLGKARDGFVSRSLNRKISTGVFTPLLMRFWKRATPNQVSVLGFTVALGGALSFFLRRPALGGTLAQLASVLDGCDGEIARLKNMQSKFGDFFDAVLDRYADSFLLFSMSYYAWTSPENRRLFGRSWTPLMLSTSMLAIFGNLMVSYTSAKSVANFGYRYGGGWTAAGRGRDLRLLALSLSGALARVHPVSVFLALAGVAVQTNAIVLRRIAISRRLADAENASLDPQIKAIIYDFDGTIADTMPFLSELALGLMVEHYGISPESARDSYRDTVGRDFSYQLDAIFPDNPKNTGVSTAFAERKRDQLVSHPIFAEVIPTLQFFRRRAVRQFLCSSTRRGLVERYLAFHGIDGYFDGCLGYEPGSPKDVQIASILEQQRLSPEEVVFVSDSPHDVDFVENIGLRFIGIQRFFSEEEFLERGLFSVKDVGALIPMWQRSEALAGLVERV